MIRHYAEPEGRVIFDHRHNAEMSTSPTRISIHEGGYSPTLSTLPTIAAGVFSIFLVGNQIPADYALVTCRAVGLSVALGYTNMRGHDRGKLSAPSPAEVTL
jgi:hypothetical protein